METIKIGVVGLGTVGTGVVKMLQAHQEKISEITGRKLELACVVVHNLKKHEQVDLGDVQMTDQIATMLDDPSIQIMVEVMGSIHPAKEYITQALQAGKHVVTANKDLIAQYGRELVQIARENHRDLFYEASVAGGIPILRTIDNSFAADRIQRVMGIVNGTTNYIMTQMLTKHWSYDQALSSAQDLGFAESDPTNDVEGLDAAFKMIILTQFAFGMSLSLDHVQVQGITKISPEDIAEAHQLGYTIKLLGIAEEIDDRIAVSVGPVLVSDQHPLATVQNENNAVMVTGTAVGNTMFYGPGAGELPTANSVLSDITTVAKNIALNTTGNTFNSYRQETVLATPEDVVYPHFIALKMRDVPGMMMKLTAIMTRAEVSFSRIIQNQLGDGNARVVIITHVMNDQQLADITREIGEQENMQLLASYKVLKNA